LKSAILIGRGRWGKILEPYIRQYFDLKEIFGKDYIIEENIDVVFVASPIDTHHEVVKKALLLKKHVFCEKPLSTKYIECLELKQLAEENNLILYTDYVEMTAPSRKIMIEYLNKIGKIEYIEGQFLKNAKENYNLLWYLHCHLLSILSLFTNLEKLYYVLVNNNIIFFENDSLRGKFYCSMSSEENKKFFKIFGSEGKIEYNYYKEETLIVVLQKEEKKFTFDEKNNLYFSIKTFSEVLEGKITNNIDVSCSITNILEKLLTNKNNINFLDNIYIL
jgi:predicted dehydrogenase